MSSIRQEDFERGVLDALWANYAAFRAVQVPDPEAKGQLPIVPKSHIYATQLNEYISRFLKQVWNPALGEHQHCLYLNLCLWDPFRLDSVENWALTTEGVNLLEKELRDYLSVINGEKEITLTKPIDGQRTRRSRIDAFYYFYKIFRKEILTIRLAYNKSPVAVRTNKQMLYEIEEEISHQKISNELEWIVAAHAAFTPSNNDLGNRYVYYIPSLFYPRERGTGIGGLILISTFSFSDVTLTKFQTVLDSILSKIGVFYLFENFFDSSVRSAISSIMARNMSHNIGSHVIPRATVEAVRRRLQTLDLWPDDPLDALAIISSLKGSLDEYTQRKSDFLAEITTEPLMATRPAFFYREVILPLVENPLLMDNIAANEGVSYYEGGRSNRLKIRTTIHGKELKAVYKCDICGGEYVYPEELPYSLTCTIHKSERLRIAFIENGDQDIEVELPGPLGEFALYSFLENYIRNVAKHNKESLSREHDLVIFISIYDFDSEYYGIKVWNNIINADREVSIGIDGTTYEKLNEALTKHIDSKLIRPDGSLKRQAWGIGEMKICAVLLRGPKDFVTAMEGDSLLVEVDHPSDLTGYPNGGACLIYDFRLMKSKRICAVLPWYSESRLRDDIHKSDPASASASLSNHFESLRKSGIWIFNTLEELENELDNGRSIASFRFGFFDCSGLAGKERLKIINALGGESTTGQSALLSKFPFRVLALVGTIATSLHPSIRLIPETVKTAGILGMTSQEMIAFLWKHWLGRWLSAKSKRDAAIVNVFLDQGSAEHPTADWARHAETFNQRFDEIKLRVFATDVPPTVKSLNEITTSANPVNVFYDRHRGLRDGFDLKQGEDWSYLLLEKHSPDFTTLFSPKFPTGPDEIWELPCELAEAGLLRILVIDERAAEFSLDTLNDVPEQIIYGLLSELANQELGESERAKKWHLAWAAKIFICTHFGIDEKCLPLHDRVAAMENGFPFLKVRVGESIEYEFSVFGEQNNALSVDAVLIHQGILDEWRARVPNFNQNEFLDRLRKHFPFVVVESGRGIPPTLSDTEKFLPFSLLQHNVLGENVGKFGLTRVLMSLARRRGRS